MKKTSTDVQTSMKIDDVVTMISPDDLIPNPYQPKSRAVTTPEEAREGWLSLERSGLIHFPVVRKAEVKNKYEVGDGWQRRNWYLYGYYEQKLDKYARIPCVVKDLAEQQMADMVIDANSERKDLNPLEWAEFYKKYLEEFGITQEVLGERFGKSQGEIANTIRLLDLPEEVRKSIISREISESHGRQLLRLNRHPEKQQNLLKDCQKNKYSVSDLSNRIDSNIYQTSKSLKPGHPNYCSLPQFDVAACQECEHAEKLNKELRCLDADCWNKKQKETQAAGNEAALEKLKEQGIERLYESNELTYKNCRQLWPDYLEKSPACQTCIHRAGLKSSYDSSIQIVCIDTECYEQKQKQTCEVASAALQEQSDELHQRIERAVENLSDENLAMSSVIMLLTDALGESIYEWFGINFPEDNTEFDADVALQKALDELNPVAMTKKLLAGLLGEYSSYEGTMKILEKLEGNTRGVEPEPEEAEEAGAADSDPLTTLEIKVPASEGAMYHISINGKAVMAQTLKFGVIKLFQELGMIPGGKTGVEYDLINILKNYPESYNRDLLIGILEGKQPAEAVK